MLSLEQSSTLLAANANGTHEITYDSTNVGLLAATYLDPEYQVLLEYQPFDLKNYTKVDCAFHYGTEQDSKVFSLLAWIVFAVPMTQVLVERLLSGV